MFHTFTIFEIILLYTSRFPRDFLHTFAAVLPGSTFFASSFCSFLPLFPSWFLFSGRTTEWFDSNFQFVTVVLAVNGILSAVNSSSVYLHSSLDYQSIEVILLHLHFNAARLKRVFDLSRARPCREFVQIEEPARRFPTFFTDQR